MGTGDVVVLEEIQISLDSTNLIETPPFSRWAASQSGTEMANSVKKLIQPVIDSISPRGMYKIIQTDESVINSYDPPSELVEGEYVVAGVLTLGEVGSRSNAVSSKFEKLVWDAIENATLQKARKVILEDIRGQTEDLEFNTTRVFAPGTRDDTWPLESRKYLFEELPTEEIDVMLKSNGNIEPPKTFTFAMGAGPEIDQAEMLISCAECEIVDDCVYAGSASIA